MVKKALLTLIFIIGLVIFVSTLQGQGSKKITLPNGEEVWDLNGEWDVYTEYYGIWSQSPTKGITKITQQGSSFVAIKMSGTGTLPIGDTIIKGELDKNGFKKVRLLPTQGIFNCERKSKISEDGNKMVIDDGEKIMVTFTRK